MSDLTDRGNIFYESVAIGGRRRQQRVAFEVSARVVNTICHKQDVPSCSAALSAHPVAGFQFAALCFKFF